MSDLRVLSYDRLPTPHDLKRSLPLSEELEVRVSSFRQDVRTALRGGNRKLCIVGPCSVHDVGAVLDYAKHLKALSDELSDARGNPLQMRGPIEEPMAHASKKQKLRLASWQSVFELLAV